MKNLSVFQTVLMASFGAFAIAGVLIFAFVVGGGGGGGIGQVVVWGTWNESAVSALIRHLADSDARFKQVVYVEKNPATYVRDLTDALAEGRGPDLFVLSGERAVKDAGKVLTIPYANLPQDQYRDTFAEGAEVFLTEKGALAVPVAIDPLVMYWNRDMLSSAGFAQPPRYWDEFYSLAEKITARSQSNAIEKSAVALGEYKNVNHAKDILAALILQAGGTIVSKDSSGKPISALVSRVGGAAQAAESAVRFYTEFANPAKADYSWNRSLPEARSAFAAGDLAIYFGLASEADVLRRMNPNLNFAVAPMPQSRTAERAVVTGDVYGLAVARTSTNKEGALTAAFLLASKDAAGALSVALGIPSARRDALSVVAEDGSELFNRQAIIVRSWGDPNPEETEDIFRDMIESVTSGALRITEAVQRADQEIGALLSSQ